MNPDGSVNQLGEHAVDQAILRRISVQEIREAIGTGERFFSPETVESCSGELLEGRPRVPPLSNLIAEGERLMVICNSCRYCEGYCAVFPAMERRLTFSEADIHYLANLCHNCAECYYSCQYAPPHEFAVNVPTVFAEIRAQSYEKYAWPRFVRVNAWGAVAVGTVAAILLAGTRSGTAANFYGVISHEAMVGIFSVLFAAIIVLQAAGFLRFWKESGEKVSELFQPSVLLKAARDALTLKNLDSHGAGCTYPDEQHSQARRRFHHFTFYGFLLCLASTTVAAAYHSLFGWEAPHAYFSIPVALGTAGGIGLLIGPVGLYAIKRRRDTAIVDVKQDGADISFLALLFLTSLTGLLLLVLRETSAMGALLRISPGRGPGLVLHLTLRKVRPWHLPLGGSCALRAGSAPHSRTGSNSR
jgi:citrate/tricarballylate utilization protein